MEKKREPALPGCKKAESPRRSWRCLTARWLALSKMASTSTITTTRFEAAEKNASRKECGMIAGLPFYATCRIKESMNQTTQDSKEKRERFKQLAQTPKVKTGKVFAADVRRSAVDPVVHKLTAWRKRNRLSQPKAASVLAKHYFHITFASLRSWEEGRRSPHPHTAAILEKFLNDHLTVPPPK